MFNKLVFIQFGKFKSKAYAELFGDYTNRLKHYIKLETREIKIERDEPEYFNKIQDKIENAIKDTTLVVFSERGSLADSFGFSDFIDSGSGVLSIVVGSSWGVPDFVEKRARLVLSIGRLTLPHEAVRVLSAEQLYRACTIIKKESYHK